MQRPAEIVWFERIIAATLALGLLNTFLEWPQMAALHGPAFLFSTQGFVFAIMVTLTLFASRRRSNTAKWIMVGLFVLGLPLFLLMAASGQLRGLAVIAALQAVGQMVAYGLLFTPSSRRWFKGEIATA